MRRQRMEREQKRLEQFRRLRKEIRGSQDYLVVGIDISKDTHNALMRTTSGNILYRRLIFNNTREGFQTLLLQVEAVRVQHGLKEVVFGMEPTANYHKPLGEFLINQEQQVVLVSPEAVKHNRPLLDGRWNKHDGKDCANIADLMCQGKCLSALKDKAPSSIGCQFGSSVEFEGQSVVKLLKEVRQSVADTQEQIEQACLKFKEYNCLLSIPGFGPSLSAMVLGAIGNPWRFQNGAQVIKMVGLDLSASQSGKSQGSPVVSKKGKAEIRYALYQAAMVGSSRDKHFVAYFTDQLRGREKEKGIKTKKRVKLAAKMLMIAWTLMKKQELFDPKYLAAQIDPIALRQTVKSGNRSIPEVQLERDRRL